MPGGLSSLHSAHHDPLDKIFLQKRVHCHNGQHHQDGSGRFDGVRVGVHQGSDGLHPRRPCGRGRCQAVQHSPEQVLQGGQARGSAAVDHVVKPGVPLPHHLPQGHRGDNRLGQRHDDRCKDPHLGRTVDGSRLLHALVNGEEIIPDDDGIVDREPGGQHVHHKIV